MPHLITTVREILTLQEYCGDVINFKSYSMSYKMKKRIKNPEENRAISLNVHETIIDRQTLEKVQAIQKGMRRKKPTVIQEPSVFSGLLKCPGCGGNRCNHHYKAHGRRADRPHRGVPRRKTGCITNQCVVIYYNCIGAFDVSDRRKIPEADIIMEMRKGVALSCAPEQVAV